MKKLTAEDAETRSPDVVAENVEQLKTIFPEAFTEEKVDFEVLKQLLGGVVEEREEKYGLNWHGKRRARQLALTPSTGTLRPCPEESVDWDTTKNLMIEGDNLEVLKLLQKSYSGKVKLIYIDPPYNTGGDFVYPDDFRDNIKNYLELTGQTDDEGRKRSSNTEASGRFHTDWLNMMYPRLKLARNLLTPDGVIFISMDYHEFDNLRKLCGEVFGEENHIEDLIWAQNTTHNQSPLYSTNHEFVVVYAKDRAYIEGRGSAFREPKPGFDEVQGIITALNSEFPSIEDIERAVRDLMDQHRQQYEEELQENGLVLDDETERQDPWRGIFAYCHAEYRDKDGNVVDEANARSKEAKIFLWQGADASAPSSKQSASTKDPDSPNFRFYRPLHPRTGRPCSCPKRGWAWPKTWSDGARDNFESFADRDRIAWGPDETTIPRFKRFLCDVENNVAKSFFFDFTDGEKQVAALLGQTAIFPNPKPTTLIARLIGQVCSDGDIVLDFFAGSGTTAHAALDLAKAGQASCRFILSQLPEPIDGSSKDQLASAQFCDEIGRPRTIAEITKERIRRVIAKLRNEGGGQMRLGESQELDLGFRVFKLASSNIRAWEPNRDDLPTTLHDSIEHLKTDRTEQDILFELLLKLGLDLTIPIEQKSIAGKAVHNIGAGTLLVCLAEQIAAAEVEPLALGIAAWHKELAPAGETAVVFRDSAFADDVAKTNLTAILQQHGLENVRSL
jgi:adenine-specific DNA-methyltransferase